MSRKVQRVLITIYFHSFVLVASSSAYFFNFTLRFSCKARFLPLLSIFILQRGSNLSLFLQWFMRFHSHSTKVSISKAVHRIFGISFLRLIFPAVHLQAMTRETALGGLVSVWRDTTKCKKISPAIYVLPFTSFFELSMEVAFFVHNYRLAMPGKSERFSGWGENDWRVKHGILYDLVASSLK